MFIPREKAENNLLYLRLNVLHSNLETLYSRLEGATPTQDDWVLLDAKDILCDAALIYAEIQNGKY